MSSSYLFSIVKLVDDALGSRVDTLVDSASDAVESASEKALVVAKQEGRRQEEIPASTITETETKGNEKTIPLEEVDERIREALQAQKSAFEVALKERLEKEKDAIRSDFEVVLIEKKKRYDDKLNELETERAMRAKLEEEVGKQRKLMEEVNAQLETLKENAIGSQTSQNAPSLGSNQKQENVDPETNQHLDDLNSQLEDLQTRFVDVNRRYEECQLQLVQSEENAKLAGELRARLEEVQNRMQLQASEVKLAEEALREQERQRTAELLQVQTLTEELRIERHSLAQLESSHASAQAQISALEKVLADAQERLSGPDSSDALRSDLEETRRERDELRQLMADFNATKADLSKQAEPSGQTKEVEDARGHVARLEKALQEEQGRVRDAAERMATLEAQHAETVAAVQASAAMAEELKRSRDTERLEAVNRIEALTHHIQRLELGPTVDAMYQMQIKLDNFQEQFRTKDLADKAQMQSMSEAYVADTQVFKTKLERAGAELEEARSTSQQALKQSEDTIQILRAEKTTLESELRDATLRLEEALQKQARGVAETNDMTKSLEEEKARLDEEVANLRVALEQASRSSIEATSRVSELEGLLAQVQSTLATERQSFAKFEEEQRLALDELAQEHSRLKREMQENQEQALEELNTVKAQAREEKSRVESTLKAHFEGLLEQERNRAETAVAEAQAAEERSKERERRAKDKLEETVKKRVEREKERLIVEARKVLDEERARVRNNTELHSSTESVALKSEIAELQARLTAAELQFAGEREEMARAHAEELEAKARVLKEKLEDVAKKRVARAKEKWETEALQERAEAVEREVLAREQRLKDKLEDVVRKRVEREKDRLVAEARKVLEDERAQFESERRKVEERLALAEEERTRIQAMLEMTDRRVERDQAQAAQARDSVLSEVERGMRLEREELAKLRETTQARISALEAALTFEREELAKMKSRLTRTEQEGARERELAQTLAQKLREESVSLREAVTSVDRLREKVSKLEGENRAMRNELVAQTELLDQVSRGEAQVVHGLKERLGQLETALGTREHELGLVDEATARFKNESLAAALKTVSEAKVRSYFANWRVAASVSASKNKGEKS